MNSRIKVSKGLRVPKHLKVLPTQDKGLGLFTTKFIEEGADFDCRCGSENCVGRIEGFRYLTRKKQKELWPYLSAYLRLKMCHPRKDLREIFSLSR